MSYPDALEILPLAHPPHATIRVPGSKSITNRALVLAALSEPGRGSKLRGALQSDDTEVMIAALRDLGFRVQTDWTKNTVCVRRGAYVSPIPVPEADLFVGNSGTTMRFLTAMVSLGPGRYRLDGVSRMRERPIEDLLAALRQLGVNAHTEGGNGYPPVVVEGAGLQGGRAVMKGDVSSQFLSGLLMAAPLAHGAVAIELAGKLVSVPYVDMTLQMMWDFGVEVKYDDNMTCFRVPRRSWYQSRTYDIEADASAASYFFAAAAVTGGRILVRGLAADSLQGDI